MAFQVRGHLVEASMQTKERQGRCPRCGEEAALSYPERDQSRVEVNCAICGRHEMSRQEVDQALEEIESTENRQRTPG
jgi:transcription elongation factor Elf1